MKNINRNIVIGSVLAAGIGAVIYPILRNPKKKHIKENHNEEKSEVIWHQDEIEKEDNKIVKSASDVLLNKIGATKSELEEAKVRNKTAYDVAIDKGFSKEQLRMFVNQDRTRDVDELALNRKISNTVAEKAKERIIEDTNNWNGMLC